MQSSVGKLVCGTLRGIGQVAFVNSAVTGAFILTGCALSNPLAALLGVISSFMGTSIGFMLPKERQAATNGLHGYNGYLVGMGMGYFNAGLKRNPYDWYYFGALILPLLFTSLLCWMTHMALRKTISTPPFTFAYNIALSCWLALTVDLDTTSDYHPSFSKEAGHTPIEYGQISLDWFLRSSAAGVGQVFFSPELTSSLIIIAGLTIGSPIAAALGFFGSMVGTSVAIFLHANQSTANVGVYGLSAVLAAISLGGFHFVLSFASVALAFFASVFSVAATFVFTGLLVHSVDGPAMTFPFCAVATFLMLAVRDIGTPVLVDPKTFTSCEAHFVEFLDTDKLITTQNLSNI